MPLYRTAAREESTVPRRLPNGSPLEASVLGTTPTYRPSVVSSHYTGSTATNGAGLMIDTISLDEATELIAATEEATVERELAMVTTVANPAGSLVAQHRMDGALLASVFIPRNKAYTAAALQMPTHELADTTGPGESLWGPQTTDGNPSSSSAVATLSKSTVLSSVPSA